eukprot:6740493-Pyramimonas_sp.AAC.1
MTSRAIRGSSLTIHPHVLLAGNGTRPSPLRPSPHHHNGGSHLPPPIISSGRRSRRGISTFYQRGLNPSIC